MSIRKAAVAASLLAASSLVLAGCSGTNAGEGATEAPSTAESTEAEAPATGAAIEYWHRLPDAKGVDAIVAEWNAANPDAQVAATKFEGSAADSYTKIGQAVKAGNAPCLAQMGYEHLGSQYVQGNLEDVTAVAAAYEGNYGAGAWASAKVGGMTVGIPQDLGVLVYFYNKATFKELGIEVPTTWDEFKVAAKTAADKGKYIGVFQPDEQGMLFSGTAASAGAKWFAAEGDAWKVTVNDEATQKVAALWQELLDQKLVATFPRWGEEWAGKLTDGTISGYIGASWEAADWAFEGQKDWAVAPIPVFDASKPATGTDGGSAVAVLKGCSNVEKAVEFADFLNTHIPDMQAQGLLPAAKGELTTPESLKPIFGDQDVFKTLSEIAGTLNPDFAFSPSFPAVATKLSEVAGKVATGEAKFADMVSEAQTVGVQALKDAGLNVAE
ncbi:MAG: extracellular solute-binding protein [Buchananella hordeovulneris]|nr:extracellular solute-binding protein [Buchananella hordeovulneris]